MKKKLVPFLFLIASFSFAQVQAQTSNKDVNPFRIGLKIGTPNAVGGAIEWVTPLFDDRFALFFDYSGINVSSEDDIEANFKYAEFGTNIYFKNTGKGLYAGLGYGKMDFKGTYFDAVTVGGELFEGDAHGRLDVDTFNVKLGARLGNKFYFRTEIGYGFGSIPDEVIITGTVNGETRTGVEEIPDVPGISENGYPLFNIGFGFAF